MNKLLSVCMLLALGAVFFAVSLGEKREGITESISRGWTDYIPKKSDDHSSDMNTVCALMATAHGCVRCCSENSWPSYEFHQNGLICKCFDSELQGKRYAYYPGVGWTVVPRRHNFSWY